MPASDTSGSAPVAACERRSYNRQMGNGAVIPTRTRTVIIGAGFGGLGLGMKLRAAGLTDFVILEKSDRVGGVWRALRLFP